MKIKAIVHGSIMRQRGATGHTDCWDDENTAEIDLGMLECRLNAVLNNTQKNLAMAQIEAFFREKLNSDY